jgi:hypothetical protein
VCFILIACKISWPPEAAKVVERFDRFDWKIYMIGVLCTTCLQIGCMTNTEPQTISSSYQQYHRLRYCKNPNSIVSSKCHFSISHSEIDIRTCNSCCFIYSTILHFSLCILSRVARSLHLVFTKTIRRLSIVKQKQRENIQRFANQAGAERKRSRDWKLSCIIKMPPNQGSVCQRKTLLWEI